MPVDRTLAQDLAQTLTSLYTDAQTRLATDLARRLASGMEQPDWAQRKLAGLGTLRRYTQNVLDKLATSAGEAASQAIVLAYARGGQAALDEVGRQQLTQAERLALGNQVESMARLANLATRRQSAIQRALTDSRQALPGAEALQRLTYSLVSKLQGTHLRVLRWDLDAYREVIATAGTPDVLLGLATRRRAAQVSWERLLNRGITGFVDKSGRRWELASYVDMATRSTVAQAAVEGHLDRLKDAGIDLVIVSNAPQECERCRRWEGKVLARSGPAGRRTVDVEHATHDREVVSVDVAGSLDEAISAGLMHPNCRHSISAYQPGITRIPTATADPQGDADRQRLRAMERQVRKWKLRQDAALTPEAKKAAGAKVREWQGKIRQHTSSTTAKRQRHREQIDLGNQPSVRTAARDRDLLSAHHEDEPASTPGQREPSTGSPIVMHPRVAAAQSTAEVESVLADEWLATTGRELAVDFAEGDLDTVREVSSTLLELGRRYPDARLHGVEIFRMAEGEIGETMTTPGAGSSIVLNSLVFGGGRREAGLAELADMANRGWSVPPGDVSSAVCHEFGHVLSRQIGQENRAAIAEVVAAIFEAEGIDIDDIDRTTIFVTQQISEYAATHGLRDIISEAFALVELSTSPSHLALAVHGKLHEILTSRRS